jgi:hypothetical protein
MDLAKEKEISDVIQYFNRQIANVFKFIDNNDRYKYKYDDKIDWVRRLIKIARDEDPPAVLERCVDKLWDNRDAILAKDEIFLLDQKIVNKYVKQDERQKFITDLIGYIRENIKIAPPEDKDYMWKCIHNMLQAAIKYRLLKNDFV